MLQRRYFRLALLALCLIFGASAWPTLPSTVDDAWISLRYARNLALGHGLVYNPGEPPVEGYTNFLWVLWSAPGTVLPIHAAGWVTGWGLLFGMAAVVCAAGLGVTLCGKRSAWALLPAALLALNPHVAIAATNGLETAMFLAGVLGAAWAALRVPGLGSARGWAPGLLCGALYLVRPEGIVVGAVLAAQAAWTRRRLAPLLAYLLVVIPYFAGRWAWFGTLVPNTFSAQARKPFFEMWAMNSGYFSRGAELWIVAGGLLIVAIAAPPRDARRLLLLALATGLTLLALRVYNWMPGGRLLLAPLALVLVCLAPALEALPRRIAAVATLALLGWTGWLTLGPPRAAEARYDRNNTVLPGDPGERLGMRIAAARARGLPSGTWLLARDGGVVPYFAGPDVNVLDIHDYSLTEPRLTGKPFDLGWVLDHEPAFIVTTATEEAKFPTIYRQERRLLDSPRVRGAFTRVATVKQHHRRFFLLWARADVAFE